MLNTESVSSCPCGSYTDSLIMPTIARNGGLFAPSVHLVDRNLLTMSPSDDLAIDDSVRAYNERAFRYLLSVERKRFDRSGQPFALVLVDLRDSLEVGLQMSEEIASGVFAALSLGLRETDFTGWYRENEVAGAVLTNAGRNTTELVRGRLAAVLGEHVPAHVAGRLQIRIIELPAQTSEVAWNRREPCQ
jgi:hypothetical protein